VVFKKRDGEVPVIMAFCVCRFALVNHSTQEIAQPLSQWFNGYSVAAQSYSPGI